MAVSRDARRSAYMEKTAFELGKLAERGVVVGGNAFSSVLVAKGQLTQEELAGAAPFSGADGSALKASLLRLGYAPEEWATLLTCADLTCADGTPLDPALIREAMCVLDPATLVVCDDAAAQAVREAYADDLVALDDFAQAMLEPGVVCRVAGMRVLNLGGFADNLTTQHGKQLMWAYLKQIPPLGEPI